MNRGARTANLELMSRAIALYADRNSTSADDHDRAPIHFAVLSVSESLRFGSSNNSNSFVSQGSVTTLQYLLLNGAKIDTKDRSGKTALLLATELGISC